LGLSKLLRAKPVRIQRQSRDAGGEGLADNAQRRFA
jgi:hypothetical protein